MGKFSRDKGVRAERYIARLLNGKRVGIAFATNAVDVETTFADYQVKDYSLSGKAILEALEAMYRQPGGGRCQFVAFKAKRGTWLVVGTLEQHIALHGDGKV